MSGQEIKFALRQLLRSPIFTATTLLTLALGIGANTAIFSVAHGVFLRPLPYAHGEQIVHVGYQLTSAGPVETIFSVPDFLDYRRQNRTFAGLVEYHSIAFNLLGEGEPDRVRTGVVSANFFDVFGVRPLLGRTFRADEEQPGAPPVLLLSHGYWRRRFGGDPGIVGQTLKMNDGPIAVIGVLPALPRYPGEDDVYMPVSSCPLRSSRTAVEKRHVRMLRLFGRLQQGVTLEQAQADLATVASRLFKDYPDSHLGDVTQEVALLPVREELTQEFRPILLFLFGTVGLILLIACINVANLLIARTVSREREVALRVALGATRGHLMRQLLTESLLLALLGGAVGYLFVLPGLGILRVFASRSTPRAEEIGIDGSVLLFTLLVSLATGLAFGLFPALHSSRRAPVAGLKEGAVSTTPGTGRNRVRNMLVVAQVAISFVLLIGAGLMVRSVVRLDQVDAGFDADGVVTGSIDLPHSKYQGNRSRQDFYRSLLARLSRHPQVVSAAVVTSVPMQGEQGLRRILIENRPTAPGRDKPRAEFHVVSQHYFRTLGIPLLAGRTFTESDDLRTLPVVVINRAMARQYWPGENPLGKRIGNLVPVRELWWTIVGIVGDVRQAGLETTPGPAYYVSFLQEPHTSMRVVVRTAAAPPSVAREIRKSVHELDPEQPVSDLGTLAQIRYDSVASPRQNALLLSLFAILAFAIAAIGLGGIVAFSVNQRRKEIGVRMALGAGQRSVLSLVLGQGLALVLSGLLLGMVGAFFLTRLLTSLLFEVRPTDPLTFVVVSVALVAAGGLACLGPARHATRVEPAAALRN